MCIADYIILNADAYVFDNVKNQDAYFAAVPIIGTIAHRVKPTCEKYIDSLPPEYLYTNVARTNVMRYKGQPCTCDRRIRVAIIRHYREHRLSMSRGARDVMRLVKVLLKNRVPIIFNIAENMSAETLKRMAKEDNFFDGMIGRFKSMENNK